MTDEMKWLQASRSGDNAAFEKIVRKYQSLVCAITFSGTGRVDISEELAQETFLRAWRNLRQLNDLSAFKAWLCTIARNRLKNYYRSRRPVPLQDEVMETLTDASPAPIDVVNTQEEMVMLEQALMQIPLEYREPLVMYYRQHQSARQVADSLGLNESTVRTRLHRARQMLRDRIADRLERTLENTAPGKQFTKAVMLAIGTAAGLSADASGQTAASTPAASATASNPIAAVMGTTAAKIAAAAAVAAIVIGAAVYYTRLDPPEPTRTQQKPPAEQIQPAAAAVLSTDHAETPHPQTPIPAPAPAALSEVNPKTTPDAPVAEPPLQTGPTAHARLTPVPESPAYVFEPNGVLSGLVTDAQTGEPVTDAEIQLTIGRIYTAKTNEHGFYAFDKVERDGNYRIKINSLAYLGTGDYDQQPMIHLEPGVQEVRHFKLDKACMVDVWVLDEEGLPISDARVYATSLADDRRREIGDSIYARKTDDNGYILLGGITPSDSPYLITAAYNRQRTVAQKGGIHFVEEIPSYAPAGTRLILNDPNLILSTEIVLKKGTSVKGYAEYLDGIPAAGLKLNPYPDWWHSNYSPASWVIEPNGFFVMDHIVPGTYNLQILIPTGEGSAVGKSLFSTQLPLPEGELLNVTVPEKSPQSLVSISGTIRFIGDKQPDSVRISASSREHGYQWAHLDRDAKGRLQTTFCIDRLEPGSYRLQFESSEIDPVTLENIQAPSEDIEVELAVVGKPRLFGIVTDARTAKPLTRFKVRAQKLKTLRGPNYVQPNQWTEFRNESGTFEIDAVGPGLYQIQVMAEDYAPQWSAQISTDDNQAILFKLNHGGSVTGIVTDPQNRPLAGAAVIPLSLAGGTNSRTKDLFVSADGAVLTDADGRFQLTCLPVGSETLKVTHPDFAYAVIDDVPVEIARTTRLQPIVLDKGAAIEGIVYDGAGRPEPGVTLYVQDDSGYGGTNDELAGRLGMAVTDPNGFYRVRYLPEQICYLRRQNEGTTLGVVRRTVMPQKGKISRINFGGPAKLTGQVILKDVPLANTPIQLAPQGDPHFGCFKAFAVTDANGNFTFYPDITGEYALYYNVPQSRDWKELAIVRLQPKQDMQLGIIPQKATDLKVYVNQPLNGPQWQIAAVFLQKGDNWTAPLAATAVPPETPDGAYTVTGLIDGKYMVNLSRTDRLRYRLPVEIDAEKPENDLIVDLPVCNCTLEILANDQTQYLTVYNEGHQTQIIAMPDSQGRFRIENMPPGHYQIGNNMPVDIQSGLASVTLSPGQTKTVDISNVAVDVTEPVKNGLLQVMVVDENGALVNDCRIWLENKDAKVDPTMHADFETIFITLPGSYSLHAVRTGYKEIVRPIQIDAYDISAEFQKPQKAILRLVPSGK